MFILKKKYNILCDEKHNLENQLVTEIARGKKNKVFYEKSLEVSDSVYKDMLIGYEELENKIAALETELSVKKLKNEQLEDDIKESNEAYNKLLATNNDICKDYNRINNSLWSARESIRQLRQLADDMIHDKDMKKSYISSYIKQLTFMMKGYEPKMYTTDKCDLEGCENE